MYAKIYWFSVEITETIINLMDFFFLIKKVGSSYYGLAV